MIATQANAAAPCTRPAQIAFAPGDAAAERLQEGLAAEARRKGIGEDDALKQASSGTAMNRLATADAIADAVVYLSSARASYIAGAILNADGAGSVAVI